MDIVGFLTALQMQDRPAEVRQVQILQAQAGRIQLAQNAAPATPPATIVIKDKEPFTKGPYFAWLAPWGAGDLKEGRDYSESMSLDPARFPAGSTIRWQWPPHPPTTSNAGVYNYLSVAFGDYYGTKVETPIPPRRIADIKTLSATQDFEVAGTLRSFDVIIDYFLTREAGQHGEHLCEIEVFLHTPPFSADYVRSVKQLGTFRDAQGRGWQVAINPASGHGPAILFMPADGGTIRRSTVDLDAMHRWLIARGVLTGKEWFNGLGLGVEVQRDDGSMRIDHFAVDYR